MLRQQAQLNMEEEVGALIGAALGENNFERTTWRNGYRARAWKTRVGEVELPIPKLRHGSYFSSFLTPRRLSEAAFTSVIRETCVSGISTRNVDRLVPAMGLSGVKRSEVSRQCQELDARVGSFLDRPLEGQWPFLWLDATYVKVRESGRIVSVAATLALGDNDQGRREVLGLELGCSEAETFRTDFFRKLLRRGLRGVQLVISDHHQGLEAVIPRTLATSWQRCKVHFLRHLPAHVRQGERAAIGSQVRTVFAFRQRVSAQSQWGKIVEELRSRFPKVIQLRDEAESEVLAYLSYPESRHAKICSANPIERLNQKIKRRSRTVEIFPCESAILRLVGALLIEQNDSWAVARSYLNLAIWLGFATPTRLTRSRITSDPTVGETGNRSQIRLTVIPGCHQSLGVSSENQYLRNRPEMTTDTQSAWLTQVKLPAGNFLRELMSCTLNWIMEEEVATLIGAWPQQRRSQRSNQRNGYRKHRKRG